MLYPLGIVQIPFNRLADAGFEGFFRSPAQLALDFAGIDGVSLVVPGTILNVGDQTGMRPVRGIWTKFVKQGTQGINHFNVLLFVMTTDVVCLANNALSDNFI
ncbi:hypothetical protein D3C81_923810 [compost metagenome]